MREKLCPRRGQGGGPFFGALALSRFHSQRLACLCDERKRDICGDEDQPMPGSAQSNRQPWPCNVTDLQLVQIVAVFAVLHHPSKHQQPRPIAHKAVGSTAGGNVTSDSRDEPLVGCCEESRQRYSPSPPPGDQERAIGRDILEKVPVRHRRLELVPTRLKDPPKEKNHASYSFIKINQSAYYDGLARVSGTTMVMSERLQSILPTMS